MIPLNLIFIKKKLLSFVSLKLVTLFFFNWNLILTYVNTKTSIGNVGYCFAGNNIGRVGVIKGLEVHDA